MAPNWLKVLLGLLPTIISIVETVLQGEPGPVKKAKAVETVKNTAEQNNIPWTQGIADEIPSAVDATVAAMNKSGLLNPHKKVSAKKPKK